VERVGSTTVGYGEKMAFFLGELQAARVMAINKSTT
jgi:hypothetical protein